jgi:NNP family nitrate/nitrite transporter-like MFS transporter
MTSAEENASASETKGTPGQGLAGATLGFFFGFAAVALFGPTAEKIRLAMDLSAFEVGLLVATPSLTGSLLRIPFSAWVDTTGGRKPFLVLLFLSALGMVGLYAVVAFLYPDRLDASYYPALLALGALCGCGIATFSVGITQVAYWFPPKRHGTALGTYAGFGNLAPGLFSFLLPLALAAWGLAHAYLGWLGFLLLGTVLYALLGRNAWYFQLRRSGMDAEAARSRAEAMGQEVFPSERAMQGLATSAGVWETWALVALYFTTFGGFLALTAWLPTYWNAYLGCGVGAAGSLTGAFSLLASLIRVVGGTWSDRYGGEKTAALSLLATLLGALLMTFAGTFAPAALGMLLVGIGMGVNNAAVFKMVPQYVRKAVGGASGWVGGVGAFGGFCLPPVMALFVERMGRIGYARGFVVLVALAVLSLGLVVLIRRKGRQEPVLVYTSR